MLSRRHTPQTIAWFRDHFVRGLLELDPPYQRRSVWNQAFKDYFVDTILLGYPAPAIFLYEQISDEGTATYFVVDGKQRLTTIFEFVDGEFPVQEDSPLQSLRGKYFSELSKSEKDEFWTYELPVEYLPTTAESILKEVFDRINRNVARLTRQELRHAKYSGAFIEAAETLADWMGSRLPVDLPRYTPTSRKQMKDVEVVTQLLLLIEDGPQTFSQDELDEATSDRDSEWPEEGVVEAEFRAAVDAVAKLLEGYEERLDYRYRLRNQADFYSFFGAVLELVRGDGLPDDPREAMDRVSDFFEVVNDEDRREGNPVAERYYQDVRSNSNGATERRRRIAVIKSVLTGDSELPVA